MRIRIDVMGQLEIIDPDFSCIGLLKELDPDFKVMSETLPGFTTARFLSIRQSGCGLTLNDMVGFDDDFLWNLHRERLGEFHKGNINRLSIGEASVLDIKIELAYRSIKRCTLCGNRCMVDRTVGEMGICGLGIDALVAGYSAHIAEELFINPSLLISLYGCGLRCKYWQQGELLKPDHATKLSPELWSKLPTDGVRSLSFIGGNPDESLYEILKFVSEAPKEWNLPIVWNCNGYATIETVELLDGIVDAYVPDLKYGSDSCGRKLSKVSNYPAIAMKSISAMVSQGVPVIVRILVLPGHYECCHSKVLEFLAAIQNHLLFVSVRDQYCPEHEITTEDGEMARRPSILEVNCVINKAKSLGLTLI
jgi:putative pyruvate formate lyase activating enzyme